MTKKLHEDMTSFGLISFYLAQVIEHAFKQNVSPKELLDFEHQVRTLAGIGLAHPSQKSPLIPLVETSFSAIKSFISQNEDRSRLIHFAKVLNGEQIEEYEIHYDASEVANLRAAPVWVHQVLETGQKLLGQTSDSSVAGEKLGALYRNIPADTTFGHFSLDFLNGLFKNGALESSRAIWPYLKGEKPLACRVRVRGLYTQLKLGSA